MKIKSFVFSPFQENTYVITNNTNDCLIIDPGCYEKNEKAELKDFIENNNLKPVKLINTHCHIDHIFGNKFVFDQWGLQPIIHKDDLFLLEGLEKVAQMYGIPNVDNSPLPVSYMDEGDLVEFGEVTFEIIHVPGHAPGHVALIHHASKSVISGDVLFNGSIGRTDLPGGDFDTLIASIKNKMFALEDDYTVYSGHGSTTTIGNEKKTNPFLN